MSLRSLLKLRTLGILNLGVFSLLGFASVGFYMTSVPSTYHSGYVRLPRLNEVPNFPDVRHRLVSQQYFEYFDGRSVYSGRATALGTNRRRPLTEESFMFMAVAAKTSEMLNTKLNASVYYRENCTSIRYRLLPMLGYEFLVTCRGRENIMERVTIVQPLGQLRATHHATVPAQLALNIIVPLKGRVDRLQVFAEKLRSLQLEDASLRLGLTLVYFDDNSTEAVRDLLTSFSQAGLMTELVLLEGAEGNKFSRGRGLQLGLERTKHDAEVVFFCDVDMSFTSSFLHRCRTTPLRGFQIFTPAAFSLYNPEHVFGRNINESEISIGADTGYWRLWGYGMLCGYKEDLLKVPGFNRNREVWGKEDIEFAKQFVNKGQIKVIRSLDPGLIHVYHQKSCEGLTRFHLGSCLQAKYRSEGSGKVMSKKYFQLLERHKLFQPQKAPAVAGR